MECYARHCGIWKILFSVPRARSDDGNSNPPEWRSGIHLFSGAAACSGRGSTPCVAQRLCCTEIQVSFLRNYGSAAAEEALWKLTFSSACTDVYYGGKIVTQFPAVPPSSSGMAMAGCYVRLKKCELAEQIDKLPTPAPTPPQAPPGNPRAPVMP